ncbi:MAG TPA: hypothetical protein VGD23_11115 [Sphingomicrobium sp.]
MNDNFTFGEWRDHRVERFVELALATPEEHRADYMRVQAKSLVDDALKFSRAGLQDDDLMPTR